MNQKLFYRMHWYKLSYQKVVLVQAHPADLLANVHKVVIPFELTASIPFLLLI